MYICMLVVHLLHGQIINRMCVLKLLPFLLLPNIHVVVIVWNKAKCTCVRIWAIIRMFGETCIGNLVNS